MASKDKAPKKERHESKRDREQAMRGMAPRGGEVEEGQFLADVPGSADSRYFHHKDSVDDEISANAEDEEDAERRREREYKGSHGSALGAHNDDIVNESSAESFPASDPPSWQPRGS